MVQLVVSMDSLQYHSHYVWVFSTFSEFVKIWNLGLFWNNISQKASGVEYRGEFYYKLLGIGIEIVKENRWGNHILSK